MSLMYRTGKLLHSNEFMINQQEKFEFRTATGPALEIVLF